MEAGSAQRNRRGGIERLWAATALTFVGVYCVARYRDALLSFFFLDDFWLLRDVSALQWGSPLDVWQIFQPTHVGFELYRPLTQTGYFALLWALFGCDASGYHAVQLLAYVGTVLLVFGIARRLTGSIQAALGASLIYATAPGNALPVFWIAAFTMTGTALVVFLMLWVWLRIESPRWRVGICTALQVVGLLASEHAVVAPVLLALVGWGARRDESWVERLRLLVPLIGLVAAYAAFKVWYLAGVPLGSYAVSANPVQWLMGAGRYALGSINVLRLLRGPQPGLGSLVVGSALVAIAVAAAWRARRRDGACRLLAVGVGVFLLALVPVLPLAGHFYDYFIGIAALGLALASVAACQLLSRRAWPSLALAVGAALVLCDVLTGQEAVRYDPVFGVIDGGARTSARWVEAVVAATQPDIREVAVPPNSFTDPLFTLGHAERVFPGMPAKVSVIPAERNPFPLSDRAIVMAVSPPHPDEYPDLPGWDARWTWIRALARWHLGPHRPGTNPAPHFLSRQTPPSTQAK